VRFHPFFIAVALLSVLHGNLGAAAKPVYLSGPEVVKMDWNTRALCSADIDGDGRNDLAMIDNDSGKIELLFQNNPDNPKHNERKAVKRNKWEPVIEDALFWHDSVAMGQYGYDMAMGDLNGDGLVDIAYTGNFTPFTILYQDKDGKWDQTWTCQNLSPQESTGTIVIADIDGNSRNDVALLTNTELVILYQDDSGKMAEPKRYRLSSGRASRLVIADINGDKLPDALFLCGSDKYRRVSARMQQSPGSFGPEIGFPLPTGSLNLTMTHSTPRPVFVSINGQTRTILTYSLESGHDLPCSLSTTQMRDYATGTTGKQGNLYAWGDFDGDGDTDIVTASPASAEVVLFRQTESGDFEEGRPYPSFSKITSLATLRTGGNGPDQIVVTSGAEDVAGVIQYKKEGRLGFPEPLPMDGKVISATVGNFAGTGQDCIVLLEKRGEEHYLSCLQQDSTGKWTRAASSKLTGVKRKPDSMMAAAIGADGADVILVFTQKEAARFYTLGKDAFTETAVDSPIRLGCTVGADASRINVSDVDGDGVNELLVGTTGYARSLRLSTEGSLSVVDQYNSRNSNAEIKGPLLIHFSGQESPHILFFNDTDDIIELLDRDPKDGVFRSVETKDSDTQTGFSSLSLIPMGNDRAPAILATGQDRMGLIPLDKTGWVKTSVHPAYESSLKNIGYTLVVAGDLNGDELPEIVAVDGTENLIDILAEDSESYESVMHFVVFDVNQHANPRQSPIEPREALIADLNHDGRNDVAVLVHDRVLVYTSDDIETLAK
jgi:hypothetical protein